MAESRRCTDCGSTNVVDDCHYAQDQVVCADCGCILTEGVLTTTLQEEKFQQAVRFSESSGQDESISRTKLKGIIRVRNLCKVLRLPQSFADCAVSYYEQIFNHPMCHYVSVEKKEAIMGSCVYITCRQRGWPLTMGTISSMLYSKEEHFSSMFLKLIKVLHIDLPSLSLQDLVTTHCTSFRLLQNSPPAPPEYAENLDKVLERTLKTLELAGELWLITGRHPIPIITAAAFLSWQSLRPAQRLSCTVSKFCQLCEIEVPPPTKKRKKEILEICLNLAKQLPWLKMVFLKKKTVIQHLGDILRHWPYLLRKALASAELSGAENSVTAEQASQANPFLPPCMKKTKKRRYESTFTESQQVITGDEDISDSEIDEYLRTPAEIKEIQELQAKLSRTLNQR